MEKGVPVPAVVNGCSLISTVLTFEGIIYLFGFIFFKVGCHEFGGQVVAAINDHVSLSFLQVRRWSQT